MGRIAIGAISRLVGLAGISLVLGLSTAAAQSGLLPPGTVQVQRVEIIDPQGFDRPLPAASALLPVGWTTQGGVVWNPGNLCNGGYTFNWQATSPNGANRVGIVPAEGWTTNSFGATGGQCPNWPYTNLRAYLEALVVRLDPQARVLDFRPREDLRRQFAALESRSPMPSGELRTWVEAGEVLFAFSEGGREKRGTIASVAHLSYSRFDSGWGGKPLETLSASTFPGFAASAPAGQLDMQLSEAIRASIKLEPEWERRMTQHRAVLHRNNLEGIRKRSEITANTGAEIREMQQKSWEQRMDTQDRMHRRASETIREVERYQDPAAAGGSVELSSHYRHAWRLQDGTYLLSNDPALNPYAATGQDARRLELQR